MNNSDPLPKLFGGPARVKLLRLFLLNPELTLDRAEILRRSKVPSAPLGKELSMLLSIGFLRTSTISIDVGKGSSSGEEPRPRSNTRPLKSGKTKLSGWKLNPQFKLNAALGELLFETDLFSNEELIKRFQVVGKLKVLIIAGIFLRETDSRIDLLLVADNVKKNVLERVVKGLEAEIGRELNYTIFSSADFEYRVSMYDKFVRDVLDYPHTTVLDKIGLEPSPYLS